MKSHGDETTGSFSSLFNSPSCLFQRELIIDLGKSMFEKGPRSSFPPTGVPSGYTYFGQFIDHDITRLKRGENPPSSRPRTLNELIQLRTPQLDLDSIYGDGFNDSSIPIDRTTGKMHLGPSIDSSGTLHPNKDLPRNDKKKALIGDDRNDENFIISQLHTQFLKLHNKTIDKLATHGKSGVQAYEEAKKETILTYQHVVLHDFLKELCDHVLWEIIVNKDTSLIWDTLKCEEPRMPIEFSGAAFRFGHSMVRKTYTLNSKKQAIPISEIFNLTGKGQLNSQDYVFEEQIIDWKFFFKLNKDSYIANLALPINPFVKVELPNNKTGIKHLSSLNLLRGNEIGLPCAQAILESIPKELKKLISILPEDKIDKHKLLENVCKDFKKKTPLWFYILSEADNMSDGKKLGSLGSLIVLDTLKGLISQSKVSILESPEWRSMHINTHPFKIEDILTEVNKETEHDNSGRL
ncbi:peroxidase family protein [Pleionea sp. CnH1-48]|uniref:peroxidase family protein n=1 Tax=Pleionea sp. CnH1-48 TaxID=2954494 RepID=UPI002097BDFA|nr:peroxidase family protein [Pleionea sp. CnH1-48]MCO7224950.1 hypothetical protein [Pleionea sp. CnH1-48]